MKPADIFCDHLDRCRQCRERPFQMCVEGAALLKKASQAIRLENRKVRAS